ncbi:hypothetical protein [Helicobacter sp. 23-1045]
MDFLEKILRFCEIFLCEILRILQNLKIIPTPLIPLRKGGGTKSRFCESHENRRICPKFRRIFAQI